MKEEEERCAKRFCGVGTTHENGFLPLLLFTAICIRGKKQFAIGKGTKLLFAGGREGEMAEW